MGFGIKKEAGSNTTPSEIVNFDKLTPTTVGVVFDPNTPQTLDVLYVSSVNASTWIWNGTAYVTYSAPATATTEWYLNGTVIDAGSNKTAPISRNNSIYTYDYDSYFNMVRIGRGRGNVQTNTVVGDGAGYSNTIGLRNLFLGSGAGSYNTTGSYNVFAGWGAGTYNSTANSNTFIGYTSGYTNTTGANNVFLGRYSGQSNTTASFNTFIGDSAGYFNTTGDNNTFLGYNSGYNNTIGFANLFLGKDSGYNNTIGGANLFLGKDSGLNNTTGSNNSFLGIGSGSNNTTGSNNAFLGNGTGRFIADGVTPVTIVSNSVYLGRDIKSLANNQTNEIVIGFNTIGKGSNTVNIGNTSITNTYLNGAVTVNNAFTLPSVDGTANYFLKTNGSGTVTWGVAGLSFFSEAQATTAPNATVYANSLTAVSTTTDADFSILPKGTGAILASIPNTIATVPNVGGNKRGQYALDLQHYGQINVNTEVASGNYSAIVAGSRNTASGQYSFIGSGFRNTASADYSVICSGQINNASGLYSFIGTGQSNTASTTYSMVIGGYANTSSSSYTISGGFSCIASGTRAVSLGESNTASGSYSTSLNSTNTASSDYSNARGLNSYTFTTWGKWVLGGGGATLGSVQKGMLVLTIRTNGNTPTELAFNSTTGADARSQMTCQDNQAMRVKGSIIGKQSGSTNVSVWDFDYVIVRGVGVGTTAIVGTANVNVVTNIPAWGTPTITADTAKGFASIKVIGAVTTNIQWVATLDSCETLYA